MSWLPARLLAEYIPMSDRCVESLQTLGKRRQSIATRLYGLSARLQELQGANALTKERFKEIVKDDPRALAIIENDRFDFDEEGGNIFLDVIEGRYFDDGWTGNHRRADRYSARG